MFLCRQLVRVCCAKIKKCNILCYFVYVYVNFLIPATDLLIQKALRFQFLWRRPYSHKYFLFCINFTSYLHRVGPTCQTFRWNLSVQLRLPNDKHDTGVEWVKFQSVTCGTVFWRACVPLDSPKFFDRIDNLDTFLKATVICHKCYHMPIKFLHFLAFYFVTAIANRL